MGRHLTFDPDKAIEYHNKGLNQYEIADLLGVDQSNISRFLQSKDKELQAINHYKQAAIDKLYELEYKNHKIARIVQDELLNNRLNSENIASVDLQKLLNAGNASHTNLGIASDKRRLEMSLPTQITANYHEMHVKYDEMDKEEQRLKQELTEN